MKTHFSKRLRLISAAIAVLIFTVSKLWSTPLEITWQLILIALPMPILYGVGFYWMLGIERKPWTTIFSRRGAKSRDKELSQDWAYEQATTEIENGTPDKAVWARVFADCDGDDRRAKAAYIKRRVARLLAEQAATSEAVFDESAESKRSRSNMKRLYVGIALVSVIAIAGLFVAPRLFPNQGTESAKFGQDDEVVGKVPAKDKDGWETIIPASGEKKWTPPSDAIETSEAPNKKPFDPDEYLRQKGLTTSEKKAHSAVNFDDLPDAKPTLKKGYTAEELSGLPPAAKECSDPLGWIKGKVQVAAYNEIEKYLKEQDCNVFTKFIDPPTSKNLVIEIIINDSYRTMPKKERIALVSPILKKDNAYQQLSPSSKQIIRQMLLLGDGGWSY